jgi:LytR cell envelope-related transcriptional attenuator
MAVLFAFSLQHEVEKYGPYVGLGAFLGLAILTVLYFAQARELKRLRDWAGRAPERAQEMEARVVAQAEELRRGGAPAAEPVPERSGTVGPAEPVAKPAAAPSGNGRPAAAPAPIPIGPRPAVAVAAAAARAQAAIAEGPPTEAHPAPTPPSDDDEAPVEAGTAVETVTDDTPDAAPSPAGDGVAPAEDEAAEDDAVQAGNGAATPPPAIPRATPRPQPRPEPVAAAPLRASTPSRTATTPPRRAVPPRRDDEGGSRAGRITLFTIGGIVAVALLAFAATQLFGGGSEEPKAAPNVAQSPTQSPGAGSGSADVADQRAHTVVTVLNGTPTDGLAGTTRDKLVKAGYSDDVGMVRTGNNTDQQRQNSVVFFAPGQRRMARDVAQVLGITAPPEAVDQDTLALANNTGEGAAGHETDAVVIVGLDQAP